MRRPQEVEEKFDQNEIKGEGEKLPPKTGKGVNRKKKVAKKMTLNV